MAFPRCPACKAAAIARGEDPKALRLPPMTWVDTDPELTPAEDAVFRTWECGACGYVALTREAEVAPGQPFEHRYLRQGGRVPRLAMR
jgi:hypothetical protein